MSAADAPSRRRRQTGAVRVLVTGATDGIGRAAADLLVARGHEVVVHGRDPDRVAAAVAELGPGATGEVADLANLAETAELAGRLADGPLDGLVNNAGTHSKERVVTGDGHELTWQVNHLAPALLTDLLLDPLALAGGRVCYVAADLYASASVDLADPDFTSRPYDGNAAYGQAKRAGVMYLMETARRLGPDAPVALAAVHPGVVGTKLLAGAFGVPGRESPAEAAENVTRPILEPTPTAAYFRKDRQVPVAKWPPAEQAALYEATSRQLGLPGLPG